MFSLVLLSLTSVVGWAQSWSVEQISAQLVPQHVAVADIDGNGEPKVDLGGGGVALANDLDQDGQMDLLHTQDGASVWVSSQESCDTRVGTEEPC